MHNALNAHNTFIAGEKSTIYVMISMAYITTYDCWFVLKIVKYTLQWKEYLDYRGVSL